MVSLQAADWGRGPLSCSVKRQPVGGVVQWKGSVGGGGVELVTGTSRSTWGWHDGDGRCRALSRPPDFAPDYHLDVEVATFRAYVYLVMASAQRHSPDARGRRSRGVRQSKEWQRGRFALLCCRVLDESDSRYWARTVNRAEPRCACCDVIESSEKRGSGQLNNE